MVRGLQSEHKKLSHSPPRDQSSLVHSLESQVSRLTAAIENLTVEKNRIIDDLRKKVSGLEKAQAQARARQDRVPPAGFRTKPRPVAIGARVPGPRGHVSNRRGSANGSDRSSASGSRRNSRNSSAQNSGRSSSANSKGSFKRFDQTGWVRGHQGSSSSKGSFRGPSPSTRPQNRAPARAQKPDANLNRIRALVTQRYKY
jgi:hypothetical protein